MAFHGFGARAWRPLRVALYSGNYNYAADGANRALNRLVGAFPSARRFGRTTACRWA